MLSYCKETKVQDRGKWNIPVSAGLSYFNLWGFFHLTPNLNHNMILSVKSPFSVFQGQVQLHQKLSQLYQHVV